jgi:hypothetical protein
MNLRCLAQITLLLCLAGCISTMANTALDRDLNGYAVAACLLEIGEGRVGDDASTWASAIVQRSHGDIEPFTRVSDAARAAARRIGPALVHGDDATDAGAKRSALLTCEDITADANVARAIAAAHASLSEYY